MARPHWRYGRYPYRYGRGRVRYGSGYAAPHPGTAGYAAPGTPGYGAPGAVYPPGVAAQGVGVPTPGARPVRYGQSVGGRCSCSPCPSCGGGATQTAPAPAPTPAYCRCCGQVIR
jgi:hypothetical protein